MSENGPTYINLANQLRLRILASYTRAHQNKDYLWIPIEEARDLQDNLLLDGPALDKARKMLGLTVVKGPRGIEYFRVSPRHVARFLKDPEFDATQSTPKKARKERKPVNTTSGVTEVVGGSASAPLIVKRKNPFSLLILNDAGEPVGKFRDVKRIVIYFSAVLVAIVFASLVF